MKFADAKPFDRHSMFFRSITLMFCKIILGKLMMPLLHHPVSGYLGYDGSSGNGLAELVAFSNGLLWDREVQSLNSIDQNKIGGDG